MFTQLVMIFSIVFLVWSGNKIFRKSKEINYSSGTLLALSLFFVGFSVFNYAIRDVFIQFEMYKTEYIFYQIGVISQLGGMFLMTMFVCSFVSKLFARTVLIPFAVGSAIFIIIAIVFFPTISIIKQAPLELIPYKVISHPWSSKLINIIFFSLALLFSVLSFSVFLYNAIKIKERRRKIKALFYGFGILFLFLPAILCVFISPIFARLGYVIGAILIYKAFQTKV